MIRFGTYTQAYTDRPQLEGESSGYTTVFPNPSQGAVFESALIPESRI